MDDQLTQPGTLIGSNEDLLTENFLRLPAVSIVRFKFVSKHWRLLLSDRRFINRYDKVSKSPGLFARNVYVPFDVENPRPPPFSNLYSYFKSHGTVRIVQSCNGLLLCSTDRGPKGHKGALSYYVFNPTTKQLAIIPSISGGYKVLKTICFMALAFHQTDCALYKVVCIRSLEPHGNMFQIQIYSSSTKKWKISVESFYAREPLFRHGVYWNGAVHWAPLYRNHLYFKLDDEQLQTLPLPQGSISSELVTMYFGGSRGHLHLLVYKIHEENALHLNVLEMLRDHSGWFINYQVELDELLGAFPGMMYPSGGYNFSVIDVVRGEKEEDTFMGLKIGEKIITYNIHDKSFKQIFSLPSSRVRSFHRYTETLTSF
ncbi:F-box protein At5g07610-like [Bidens hawaiensis]|uniref:F-box protein At5g07610-like n=1 Tax=Bidens hawaiensis TaxID=980011 RepID=UPI00404AA92A